MNKKIRAVAAVCLALSMMTAPASLTVTASAAAPDINDYVRMDDMVSFDMTDAEFWIENSTVDPNKTIHSKKNLPALRENNAPMIGYETGEFSIYDVDGTLDGDIVRYFVGAAAVPDDPSAVYLRGKPTTSSYWEKLREKANYDAIPDTVDVKYGYSIIRSSLRAFPSYDFIGEDQSDRFYDVMVWSEFMPFAPLIVVHESTDGEWYYVMFEGFCGWVRKDCVAICEDKEDWLARKDPDEFLMVTGREVRLQDDVVNTSLSGSLIPMGTKLPLVKAEDAPEFINDRETKGCYIVKLPIRDSDGMIEDRYSLISIKEDVNIGYLPYTGANVVRQAFKLFGDRYGWAGVEHSNDCSGITDEIYRCFGIYLPRTSGDIAGFNGKKTYDVSEYSAKKKINLLSRLPIGTVIYFRGHIMIYIGVYNGDPYCISATGTYLDDDGKVYDTNSVIVTNMRTTHRADGQTWIEHAAKFIVV